MVIDITLRDEEKRIKAVTINNMSLDLYEQLNNEDIINELFDYKYYLNTIYDKINILDFSFILNKQSKKFGYFNANKLNVNLRTTLIDKEDLIYV